MGDKSSSAPEWATEMTHKMVVEYLQKHPDFLQKHPELLEILVPPQQEMGDGVLDFQHFALNNLRGNMQDLKDRLDGVVHSARNNMSVQSQVHQASLKIMKTRSLEHLLEILGIDMARLFNVDVVRLVIESEMAELYHAHYSEQNYSGIGFIQPGGVLLALGNSPDVALINDCNKARPVGFETLFEECSGLIESCALLRLSLQRLGREAVLAFGVRDVGRFDPQHGTELLKFLAQVVEHKLDQCLTESEIEKLL